VKTALLGFFGDSESAELARAQLLISGLPINRITLTTMQGPGQSRARSAPATRDTFLSSLRTLFNHHDPGRAEGLADRVERGAATVSAYAHSSAAARRAAAILRDCGAFDIVRDTQPASTIERSIGSHEATWPTYVWPAT
jgi:hypothetical protein